jgi:hypothetical protein
VRVIRSLARSLAVATSAALLVAVAAGPATAAGAAVPATRAATDAAGGDARPRQPVIPESADAHGLTVRPPRASGPDAVTGFTVSITRAPRSTYTGRQEVLLGASTGFSDWNWVNVWIRPAGTRSWTDGGGNWVTAGRFAIPVAYPTAGSWETQLSLGRHPQEQYSGIAATTVRQGWPSRPYVVEAGTPGGQRYLTVSGRTRQRPGTLVYLWVDPPRGPIGYSTWATVASDGTYAFDHADGATLLGPAGDYVVRVTSQPSQFPLVGSVVYHDLPPGPGDG